MKPITVGILGGGQLARMMALAGYPLGINFVFFDPVASACAGQLGELMVADYDDYAALDQFCEKVDHVTLDFENVPVAALRHVAKQKSVFPAPEVLEIAQDRLTEKTFCRNNDIPTAEFVAINNRSQLLSAAEKFAFDGILKTRRLGYDGKGQHRINSRESIQSIPDDIFSQDLILEQRIDFFREVSVIVVRNAQGQIKTWPLCENHHKNGILATTIAPAQATDLDQQTIQYATKMAEQLNYTGVLVVEFFQTKTAVMVNEMAPRVHNSGHWTIEGADTSQFENHLRAGLGLPLGSTQAKGVAAMLNWIGAFPENHLQTNEVDLFWHIYGKQPRAGRKIGHSTILSDNRQDLHDRIVALAKNWA